MHRYLEGKNILFIGTAFFSYEALKRKKMEELGATVYYYNERSVEQAWERALLRVSPYIFLIRTKNYYDRILNETKTINFDYVYIYGATMIDTTVLRKIKACNSRAKFILYLADSVYGNKRVEKLFTYFDKVFTFDRCDYELFNKYYPNIRFLPLFYCDEYKEINDISCLSSKYDYDVLFVGTIHSDRYKFLMKIKEEAEKNKLKIKYYMYLQSRFMFYFYKFTDKAFKKAKETDFCYTKISTKDITDMVKKSRVVVDAQYPKNSGLTMRTIEMLGLHKKIITTNKDIANYDFYNVHNICIVDRENPVIDIDFLYDSYVLLPDEIYDKYSLDKWIYNLLISE